MNRKQFIKRIGLGAMVAPTVAEEIGRPEHAKLTPKKIKYGDRTIESYPIERADGSVDHVFMT